MRFKWKANPIPKRKPWLFPFFKYFGTKWRTAPKYPRPMHGKIIEPFAGAAGYSLRYPHLEVILYDVDPAVVGVWNYLIQVTKEEIKRLPSNVKTTVHDLKVCQEAKWLIGFWLNMSSSPKISPSIWMKQGLFWGEVVIDRLVSQVDRIRHWKVYQLS